MACPLSTAYRHSQIAAVFDDFPIAADKIGMLGSAAITRLVVREMVTRQPPWLVVDPVMIASSGARLLDEHAATTLCDELLPLADILTPNVPEAEALLGTRIRTTKQFDAAADALLELGASAVLPKGGHGEGAEVIDRFYDARGLLEIKHPRLPLEVHGTGCSLAAAIAAELAKGRSPRSAIRRASAYVYRALMRSYHLGGGSLQMLHH